MPAVLQPNAAIPITAAWRDKAKRALTEDMTPEGWRGLIAGLLEFFIEEAQEPEHQAADEKPRTLYVRRPLKNAADVIAWAKKAGLSKTLTPDDMHVTLAHSKTPMDWSRIVPDETMTAADDGAARSIEKLGDKGAVVLRFTADNLSKRWADLKDAGAVWDFPSYKPHVTITYEGGDIDLSKIVPFSEPLEFGPEIFEEVDEGWADKVKHAEDADFLALDRESIKSKDVESEPMALDRDSLRTKDIDGRLHVAKMNISKACVNPYLGSEIPGWKKLGLDKDKRYSLLRDPEEIAKSAATANGVQILRKHKPVNAEDHKPNDVVGALGNDAVFEHPYLTNSATFWPAADIESIESGKKKQISMGYRYRPDMTPGNWQGTGYDGVMRDIVVNHVALVEDGRAGSDVCVTDSADDLRWAAMERALLAI